MSRFVFIVLHVRRRVQESWDKPRLKLEYTISASALSPLACHAAFVFIF